MVRRFSIFIVIGRFKIGVEIPVGSVPDVVNDIVPLNVAELPLKLRFKRLKLISRCLCSPIPLGPTIVMFAVNFRLELSLLLTSESLILHLPVRIHAGACDPLYCRLTKSTF